MVRVIGVTSAYGSDAHVDEEPAAEQRSLAERLIDGQGRARDHVLVVDIGGHTDDAHRHRLHADELDHRIGPDDVPVERFLIREHAAAPRSG